MINVSFLLYGAIGFAVGAQTLDRRESSRPQRVLAIVVMAIAFLISNLAALSMLSS
jgi:hypothetical protein